MLFLTSYSKKYIKKVKLKSPRIDPFNKIVVKWCNLIWPRKRPKFSLHPVPKQSMGFTMAVLTPNSGIQLVFCLYNLKQSVRLFQSNILITLFYLTVTFFILLA